MVKSYKETEQQLVELLQLKYAEIDLIKKKLAEIRGKKP